MKRPWNIVNAPVYSLATYNKDSVNMNICTYVNAVSMQPKKYAIAIYHNTQTLKNIECSDYCVLQLLHTSQFNLIKKLGQISGLVYNKKEYLTKKSILESWECFEVLKDTSARLLLKKEWSKNCGDHDMYVFDVVKYKTYNSEYLDTLTLSNKKIIRI